MELDNEIKILVKNAKTSQLKISEINENKINNLIKKIKNKILKKSINEKLSTLAVQETKFGNKDDKIKKNFYKTNNLVSELLKIKLFKPYEDKRIRFLKFLNL